MLGENISGSEYNSECVMQNAQFIGLSLLPVETVFSSEKTRTRVSGKLMIDDSSDGEVGHSESEGLRHSEVNSESLFSALDSLPVSGYEIHMGRTRFVEGAEKSFLAQVTDSVSGVTKLDGAIIGNIFGTYIHGFFDQTELCRKFIEILAKRKGIDFEKSLLAAKEK